MFSSCFSNPDLRHSELSLDAMMQRTSSSSSSSPSSQGGSVERRGIFFNKRKLNHNPYPANTGKCMLLESVILTGIETNHKHIISHGFRGCQRDISFSSALSACLTGPVALCLSKVQERWHHVEAQIHFLWCLVVVSFCNKVQFDAVVAVMLTVWLKELLINSSTCMAQDF